MFMHIHTHMLMFKHMCTFSWRRKFLTPWFQEAANNFANSPVRTFIYLFCGFLTPEATKITRKQSGLTVWDVFAHSRRRGVLAPLGAASSSAKDPVQTVSLFPAGLLLVRGIAAATAAAAADAAAMSKHKV